jgi:electron transfer flavoprotein beta subunit
LKLLVSVKVVPDYEQVRMSAGSTTLDTSSTARVVYTFDELALEAALRVKDADTSAEVVVVSLTDDANKIKETVKKALAMGADKAVIVEDKALATADSYAQAKILKAVAEQIGGVDVLTFGIGGIQGEAFPTGVEVAGLLGLPVVSYVSEYKINGATIEANRLVEKGNQKVTVSTPAVIVVGKFQENPRLPTFKGIMGAKNKPLDVKTLTDLSLSANDVVSSVQLTGFTAPAARGTVTKLEGEAADTVASAMGILTGKKLI